jgi:hypothetical protein
MTTADARSLPAAAQEDLRRRTVSAVLKGMTHAEAAQVFGVARPTVTRWVTEYRQGGAKALKAKRRGRPPAVAPRPPRGRAGHPAHPGPLPRPTPPALRPLDPGGSPAAPRGPVWAPGVGLDRRPLPETLGPHAPETPAAGLRAGSRGGPPVAGGGVPGHPPGGQGRRG